MILTIVEGRIVPISVYSNKFNNKEYKSMESVVDRLLKNMGNMHELGRQRAFELGNPFYAQFKEDSGYWRKELPTGEKYLVSVEVIFDEQDMPIEIKDTIIRKLN